VRDVQTILMTNDESLSVQDVIELYQLGWQIELFIKEPRSTPGLDRYRFREFERVETWVKLVLATFIDLEWVRARQLRKRSLTAKQRSWWPSQRTYGLSRAVRQSAEQKELDLLAEALETPEGRNAWARSWADRIPRSTVQRSDHQKRPKSTTSKCASEGSVCRRGLHPRSQAFRQPRAHSLLWGII
jgi:hypothetical protein